MYILYNVLTQNDIFIHIRVLTGVLNYITAQASSTCNNIYITF